MTKSKEKSQGFVKGIDNLSYSKNPTNEELIKRERIDDSPFIMISIESKKQNFAIMGSERITEIYESKEQVIDALSGIDWKIMISVIATVVNSMAAVVQAQETINKQ